jgi:DNA polymerase III subunit delta
MGSVPIKSDELFSSWNRNQWKPVYLFAGVEDFLIEQAVRQAADHWLKEDPTGLNRDRFDADTHDASDILQAIQTVPFLSSIRLIQVENVSQFSAADQRLLADHLSRLAPETRVLLIWGREWRREDARKPLVEALFEQNAVVVFWTPFPEQAQRWLSERASRHYKKTLTPQAAAWLVQQSTEGLRFLDQELAKCSAFVGNRPEIDLEDVQASFGYQRSASPFEWLTLIRQKSGGKSIQILDRLLEEGEEPIRLLALLSKTIRDWLSAKNDPSSMLALRFHVKRGEEYKFAQELGKWSEEELAEALRRCVETEQSIKSGRETPEMALTLLVLSLGGLEPANLRG